ncbi:hypothetical protein HGK75_05110 [uncultured bacterium]|nr:hypothetical protein HGK75_05110 [uncultured bacterium]
MEAQPTSPKGSQFMPIIKGYLDQHHLDPKINPLFTSRHMNYDVGLYESLNVFLTLVAALDASKRDQIVKFLNSEAMQALHNEEFCLDSENPSRQKALDFIKKITK